MYHTFQKFFAFCSPEDRKKFHLSIVLGVFSSLFTALKIPAIGVMVMAILGSGVTPAVIWTSFGIMLLSVFGTSAIKYFSVMLQTEAGYGTAAQKRVDIAEHLRYLPMGYFNENSLGKITSVTTNTMELLSDVGTRVVLMATEGALTTLMITLMILFYDVRIGLVVICGILLFALVNLGLQKAAKAISQEKLKTDTALVEKILEYIKGIAEVKSYRMTGKLGKKLGAAIDDNVKANSDMEVRLVPYMTGQNFVAQLTGVAVALTSLYLYCSGKMELLSCIMMVICSFLIMESLVLAGMKSSLMRAVNFCIDQAQEILSIPEMDISGKDQKPAVYDLRADHISFAYEDKKIIDDISVTIPEKTTTAIVGPSGGGKTTLCHLLSRFWDVDQGTVTLGGVNIKDYSMDSLMENFSFVFQDVYLFKDTIANNIRFGQPEASMEAVVAAAKQARCHDFIMKLPKGYDTVIGEDGSSLSGGERQRLSIARAIMKDAPIIILDEATANVDPENEQDLVAAIEALTREKTIIMIAHRLKTVRHADQILVVDQGRIVQKGTHEELIRQEGIYRRFIGQREQAVSWKL